MIVKMLATKCTRILAAKCSRILARTHSEILLSGTGQMGEQRACSSGEATSKVKTVQLLYRMMMLMLLQCGADADGETDISIDRRFFTLLLLLLLCAITHPNFHNFRKLQNSTQQLSICWSVPTSPNVFCLVKIVLQECW